MKLVTVQPESVWEKCKRDGVFRADPEKGTYADDEEFRKGYAWLIKKMEEKIGVRPQGVLTPIWAWYRWEYTENSPEMELLAEYGKKGEQMVRLELEIDEKDAVLTDYDTWEDITCGKMVSPALTEFGQKAFWAYVDYVDTLPAQEREKRLLDSWEAVFDTDIPEKTSEREYSGKGMDVQATFWELYPSQVTKVTKFTATGFGDYS